MFDMSIHTRGAVEYFDNACLARELSISNDSDFEAIRREAEQFLPLVRRTIRRRKSREALFGSGLFSDPAWDILLALYVSKLQQVRVKVTSAIEESGVPSTTGLRWINELSNRGAIVRFTHPTDARCTLIELSDDAAVTMTRYLVEFRDDLMKIQP